MTMMRPNRLNDEAGRLATLHRYEILDTQPETEFSDIVNLLKTVFGMRYAAVNLIDADRQWMKAASGMEPGECHRDDAFCSHTIRQHRAMSVENAARDPRFSANPFVTGEAHIRSYLGVPLTSPEGYNIGALCVFDTEPRSFGPADVEVLDRFSKVVMSQLEMRLISRQDSLTGGQTRRAFIEAMNRVIGAGQPATLVLLDVDNFKTVNDSFGHPVGDLVLNSVAQILRAGLRRSDALGRLGGDEFGLLLPGTEGAGALALAERLRGEVAAMRLPALEGQGGVAPTLSIGIAALGAGDTREDWMERADQALYAAKRAGRNRSVLAGQAG